MIKQYKISTQKTLLRGTDEENFQLKRKRQQLPIIIGQPVDNVFQFKYVKNNIPGKVTAVNNVVSLVVGIGFTINVLALDPSNTEDPTNVSNLRYVWKYNGGEIFVANNVGNGKGTSSLRFTDEQSRVGLTGEYVCEVTNQYGTTTTAAFTLEIVDATRYPLYYRNLITNGCGEAGTDGWTADDKITVSEFNQNTTYFSNFGTIERLITTKDAQGNYVEIQPATPFKFTKDTNWANLERYFQDTNFANTDGAFLWKNLKPSLIQNEHPYEEFASFFPSMKYVDDYNKNENKNGLQSAFKVSPTYFTREAMGFEKDGEPQTVQLTQTIDLSDYKNHIDGRVVGIDNIVGRFFCYIGVGLDKYEYEIITSTDNEENQVPADPDLFNLAFNSISPAVDAFLDRYALAKEAYINAGGTFISSIISAVDGQIPRYNTFVMTAKSLELFANDQSFPKLVASNVTRINLIPKVHNTANIKITAIRENQPPVELSNIQGPSENDLFAAKELAFLSHYLQRLFTNTATLSQKTPIYYQDKKICEVGPGSAQGNADYITSKVAQYDQSYYGLQNTPKEVLSDTGVQAFFAVGSGFNIPKGTRSLQVSVTMNHNSRAYFNTSPQNGGAVTWNQDTLYAEHLDEVNVNGAFYKANNPKIAVTQMKLSLYDNEYGRIEAQPTFFIPENSIISNRREALRTANLDDSIHNRHSYFITPVPDSYFKS